ncbi:MAG: hypothetical protein IT367_20555 [Candidatus Hydrogenedentes bacterium]|nr:hypothetical protein [Candidatus Hydrogenedentota bacterium]
MVLRSDLIDVDPIPKNVVQTIKKIKAGYTNGVRVQMGKLEDFINTSCVASLDFVFREDDDEDADEKLMELLQSSSDFNQMSNFLSYQNVDYRYQKRYRIKKLAQIRGAVKRSYSYSHHTNDGSIAQNILNSSNIDEPDDQADTNVLSHIRADGHTLSTSNRRDNLLRDKEVHDIIALLPHASSIQDQADILHYLCMNK